MKKRVRSTGTTGASYMPVSQGTEQRPVPGETNFHARLPASPTLPATYSVTPAYQTGDTNKEVSMFELLLLIGFLYAGFFPPVPSPSRSGKTSGTGSHRRFITRWLHPNPWMTLKKLVGKKRVC